MSLGSPVFFFHSATCLSREGETAAAEDLAQQKMACAVGDYFGLAVMEGESKTDLQGDASGRT